MKIIYPPRFFTELKDQHLLLDCSFFIDSSNHKIEFEEFISRCRENNITLVTLELVKAEFLKGSENSSKYDIKREFLDRSVNSILPVPPLVYTKHLPELVKRYGEMGKGTSIVDFILCATLHYYQTSLFLLTKNPKDFPNTVTDLHSYFLLYNTRALQPYLVLRRKNETVQSESDSYLPF